jgi:hypothetical protein
MKIRLLDEMSKNNTNNSGGEANIRTGGRLRPPIPPKYAYAPIQLQI